MIDAAAAYERLLGAASPLGAVRVPFRSARGRVLAETILADRDFPAADRSAMDGFAVRTGEAGRVLRVVGEVRAGGSGAARVGSGEAVRIFTGGVLPEGAEGVVMAERTLEDRAAGTVRIDVPVAPGEHVRRRGEDLAAGATIVARGASVRAAEIAALASVGRKDVLVVRRPTVAILSTGDEVVPPEAFPEPHQIRNSNGPMLAALVGEGAAEIESVADDREALSRAILGGLEADVLLVTGGVSVGDYDLVAEALIRAGVETLFHRVAMRPGKPILAGKHARGFVLGLPGNPLSAFTGFHVFGRPLLRRLAGEGDVAPPRVRARLSSALRRKPGRVTYHLARLDGEEAIPVRSASSGDVLSLARANAFVVEPGGAEDLAAGAEVTVEPWPRGATFPA